MSAENRIDQWMYIVDPPASGTDNMRTDSRLLDWVERAEQKCTVVRFYRWAMPTISIGRNQRPDQLGRGVGVPVVQRPTGGRAVLHGAEVTYAVVSNDSDHFPQESVSGTYGVIAQALKKGLEGVGVKADLVAGIRHPQSSRRLVDQNPCFLSASRNELLWRGRKIVGSAQRRLKRSFLQHGSVPLKVDYDYMARVLHTDARALRDNLVSLDEARGRETSFDVLCGALKEGFESCFGVTLQHRWRNTFPRLCDFSGGIASQ